MVQVSLASRSRESVVILPRSRNLGDNPVILQAVAGDLAVDMRHMPVQPGSAQLVVEAIHIRIPCPAAEAISCLNEQRLLSYSVSALEPGSWGNTTYLE